MSLCQSRRTATEKDDRPGCLETLQITEQPASLKGEMKGASGGQERGKGGACSRQAFAAGRN